MTQHTFGANKQFHGHFLDTGRFDSRILLKSVWDESEADLAAFFLLLGLCGQSIVLIKGGAKRQLKSTGSGLGKGRGPTGKGRTEQFSHRIKCERRRKPVMSYRAPLLLKSRSRESNCEVRFS